MVIACQDLNLKEHEHYSHTPNTYYSCPSGCQLKWYNICQIITHLEEHLPKVEVKHE